MDHDTQDNSAQSRSESESKGEEMISSTLAIPKQTQEMQTFK